MVGGQSGQMGAIYRIPQRDEPPDMVRVLIVAPPARPERYALRIY
jgi:hypothetical protein